MNGRKESSIRDIGNTRLEIRIFMIGNQYLIIDKTQKEGLNKGIE